VATDHQERTQMLDDLPWSGPAWLLCGIPYKTIIMPSASTVYTTNMDPV
jgi:hypothetical protein